MTAPATGNQRDRQIRMLSARTLLSLRLLIRPPVRQAVTVGPRSDREKANSTAGTRDATNGVNRATSGPPHGAARAVQAVTATVCNPHAAGNSSGMEGA